MAPIKSKAATTRQTGSATAEAERKTPNEGTKGNGSTKEKEGTKGFGIVESASNIILRAAGILEEEIAKGILAAKDIEGKLTDVPKLRSDKAIDNQKVDDLFVRFRRDAHDIIDLVVDLAAIAAQNAGKISSGLMRITTSSDTGGKKGTTAASPTSAEIPLIQVPKDLQPGESVDFPVTLENDSSKEEKNITFLYSPFTDTEGKQLASSALRFDPNPLKIPISSKATVQVTVAIPKTAKKGSYSCFVQGKDMDSLKASVMVKVV